MGSFQLNLSSRKSWQKYKITFLIYLLILEPALKVEDFKLSPSKVNSEDVKKKKYRSSIEFTKWKKWWQVEFFNERDFQFVQAAQLYIFFFFFWKAENTLALKATELYKLSFLIIKRTTDHIGKSIAKQENLSLPMCFRSLQGFIALSENTILKNNLINKLLSGYHCLKN